MSSEQFTAKDWTGFAYGERVKLDFGYRGFPASLGTVKQVMPYGVAVLFDGEEKVRVLPRSMIIHADDQSTNNSREVPSDPPTASVLQTVLASEQQPRAWMPGLQAGE